jgi:hypothetical protein
MVRRFATTSLATLALGAAALAGASVITVGSAQAWDGRHERGWDRPAYGWRPAPPVFHGYWGERRWRRHDGYGHGFRAPPPPPAYRYGWR